MTTARRDGRERRKTRTGKKKTFRAPRTSLADATPQPQPQPEPKNPPVQ